MGNDGSVGIVKSDINKAKWQVRDKHWIYTNELIINQVWDQVRNQVWDQVRNQAYNQVWYQILDRGWDQIGDDLRW